MKKTTFAILFSGLLIFSCVFASCNAGSGIFGSETQSTSPPETTSSLYAEMIRDLEDQIVELQQNQYISNAEREKELNRLETLLTELKQQVATGTEATPNTSATPTDTSKPSGGNSSDTQSSADTQAPADTSKPSASKSTFLYTLDGSNATITGYTGTDQYLTIPSVIDGYTVTAIADSAFNSTDLKSVTIPNGVTKIGWFAFQACPSLVSITIPSSVTRIGYSAFPSDSGLFTIYCHSDSFAQQYAKSYGLSYAII